MTDFGGVNKLLCKYGTINEGIHKQKHQSLPRQNYEHMCGQAADRWPGGKP